MMFDKDGYPTDEYLNSIADFDGNIVELLEMVKDAWRYPDRAQLIDGIYVFSTGGWSGNEDLIGALQKNKLWWFHSWNSIDLTGGFLAIAVTKKGNDKIAHAHSLVTELLWMEGK